MVEDRPPTAGSGQATPVDEPFGSFIGDAIGDAAARLAALGPVVALKLGAGGALVVSPGRSFAAPVEPVGHVVDAIGAGDSFDAGFVAAWLAGLPLRECAAWGNACGRASTQAQGGIQGQLCTSAGGIGRR